MSTVKTLTATGVATGKHAILFGITASSLIDPTSPSPPSGEVSIVINDAATADGTGDVIARLILPATGGMGTVLTFPAGVRCGNGIAVNITNSSPDAHPNLVVSIDYS